MTRVRTILPLLGIWLAVVGCSDPTSPSTARVNVLLTDAPIDLSTVNAVNVTLDRILLFGRGAEDDEGMEMDRSSTDGQGLVLDLLEFQGGKTVVIASLDVPPGDYRRLRMYVVEASLTMDDPSDPGTEMEIALPVDVPSGKVDIPVAFSVSGGENMDLVLDFDAALSVQVNETSGNDKEYLLRPVITPVGGTRR